MTTCVSLTEQRGRAIAAMRHLTDNPAGDGDLSAEQVETFDKLKGRGREPRGADCPPAVTSTRRTVARSGPRSAAAMATTSSPPSCAVSAVAGHRQPGARPACRRRPRARGLAGAAAPVRARRIRASPSRWQYSRSACSSPMRRRLAVSWCRASSAAISSSTPCARSW